MKSIAQFLKTTFTGGILFLLPVVLLFVVINKAHHILLKISAPLANLLPDVVFWFDGSQLLAIVLLIALCFLAGMLFKSIHVKKIITKLEDNVLSFLPGYSFLKSVTADSIGEKGGNDFVPVMIRDDESWSIGFLIEEQEALCTVFIPEAPKYDSGEIKIIPLSKVKKINVPIHTVTRSIKNYGKGAAAWLNKLD